MKKYVLAGRETGKTHVSVSEDGILFTATLNDLQRLCLYGGNNADEQKHKILTRGRLVFLFLPPLNTLKVQRSMSFRKHPALLRKAVNRGRDVVPESDD